jgi:hypothetical protein
MHIRFACALARRSQQAGLADTGRALDHHQPARACRRAPDGGANDLQLRLAFDELVRSGDSHQVIVITAGFRVKFRVLTL